MFMLQSLKAATANMSKNAFLRLLASEKKVGSANMYYKPLFDGRI